MGKAGGAFWGSIESLRWSDVGDDVVYLRAENSKTRKPETVPLEGELLGIIERRRDAAVIRGRMEKRGLLSLYSTGTVRL